MAIDRIKNTIFLSLPMTTGYYQLIGYTLPEDSYPTYQVRFKEDRDLLPKSWTKAATISRYGVYENNIREALERYKELLYKVMVDSKMNLQLFMTLRQYLDTALSQKNDKAIFATLSQIKDLMKKIITTGKKREKVTEISGKGLGDNDTPKKAKVEKTSKLSKYQVLVDELKTNNYTYDEMVEYLKTVENLSPIVIGKLLKADKPVREPGKRGRKPGSTNKIPNNTRKVVETKTATKGKANIVTLPTEKQEIDPTGYVWVDMGRGKGFYAPNKNTSAVSHGGTGKKGNDREDGFIPGKFKKLAGSFR